MGLVVNLADQTVIGFGTVAHIDRADAASISFGGEGPATLRTGTIYVWGEIDRVTGATWAETITTTVVTTRIYSYDLVCKVANRLF
jgi:hypothetical protein